MARAGRGKGGGWPAERGGTGKGTGRPGRSQGPPLRFRCGGGRETGCYWSERDGRSRRGAEPRHTSARSGKASGGGQGGRAMLQRAPGFAWDDRRRTGEPCGLRPGPEGAACGRRGPGRGKSGAGPARAGPGRGGLARGVTAEYRGGAAPCSSCSGAGAAGGLAGFAFPPLGARAGIAGHQGGSAGAGRRRAVLPGLASLGPIAGHRGVIARRRSPGGQLTRRGGSRVLLGGPDVSRRTCRLAT